ncbi:MAG: hypothetical protein KatS3mg090_0850 [Patescibacteria group bacterium]|nr:MAG: hypothetical protein KatS3mg090_0850 [Patescibacteria group bacterium]
MVVGRGKMKSNNSKKRGNNPLVSVIMPVYNAGNFLVEAIESIRKQTYKNWELIAIDDRSKDKSWQILKKYSQKDKRIKIFRLPKHKGLASALNLGLKKARGYYIARMDADDISHPQRLEKQIKYLNKHKDVILVGTQVEIINTKGKSIAKKFFPCDHQTIYKKMIEIMPIQHATILTYAKIFKKFSYQNHTTAEDAYLFFKLLSKGKFANTKEILYKYRIHYDSNSLKNPKKTFYLTFKSRIKAILYWNYKPSIRGIFINIVQILIVSFLPNFLIISLYEFWRFKMPLLKKLLIKKLSFEYFLSKFHFAFR